MDNPPVPPKIWIKNSELTLVDIDIYENCYSFCYEGVSPRGSITYKTAFTSHEADVYGKFIKRLESIGGTIEDPND